MDDAERIQPATVEEWSAWLREHHTQPQGVWLVSPRTAAQRPFSYEEAVMEALRYGWVDSTVRPVDADRSMMWFAPRRKGSVHPTMQAMDEMIAIFAEMGFSVAEGPDIEDDFHNFTALNFPPKHPAREMHDTFFLPPDESGERKLLRTHTSPVQIRALETQKPPLRIIVPGRTYRMDSDATHSPMFHQMEGLVIDKAIHMGHLKWTLETFIARFFEVEGVTARFRPHHFPFTEPSAEMDIGCDRSGGELKIGQGSDWLEVLGCGMVHPNVLRASGVCPDEYQGFAFGLGVDRFAMLKYGVPDLRDMFASDTRWLSHYGFSAFVAPNAASGLS